MCCNNENGRVNVEERLAQKPALWLRINYYFSQCQCGAPGALTATAVPHAEEEFNLETELATIRYRIRRTASGTVRKRSAATMFRVFKVLFNHQSSVIHIVERHLRLVTMVILFQEFKLDPALSPLCTSSVFVLICLVTKVYKVNKLDYCHGTNSKESKLIMKQRLHLSSCFYIQFFLTLLFEIQNCQNF